MALLAIVALVFLLYWRTLNYNYVIDDNVKRNGYMYEVPLAGPPPDFWATKPSKWYRLFVIGMHCVNVSVVYLLWGWAPALLFAIHPVSVWGTAWITGNYYATTAYFVLIAYYILHVFPNVWGALAACALYTAALNSTICALTVPFLYLFPFFGTPWGLMLFWPLGMYLRGKRFRTGIKTRLDFNKDKPVDASFTWRRLILMTKVIARYVYITFCPEKQGFFRAFGRRLHEKQSLYDRIHAANEEFWWSLAVVAVTATVGFIIHPVGTLWFFGIIALHSQWNMTGQFFAERYLYLPIVGMCVVVGTALQPYPILMTIVATYLTYRTHKFIPVWQNQQEIWKNDVEKFPENAQVYNNLAQWYMNFRTGKPMPVFRVNEIAMLLQKGLAIEPDSWEIHMNFACFAVQTNDLRNGLACTKRAIELLEPISGGSGKYPLAKLKEQEGTIARAIKKKEEEAKKKQGEAGLSPPQEKKEEGNGKSTKEETGVPEPCGAGKP